MLSHDAGQKPQLPVSPAITRVNNPYTDSHSVPRQPCCFSFSVQYSINYTRPSTLYYKIGFVLDDFVQLRAHVTVLRIFKVGEAKQ